MIEVSTFYSFEQPSALPLVLESRRAIELVYSLSKDNK